MFPRNRNRNRHSALTTLFLLAMAVGVSSAVPRRPSMSHQSCIIAGDPHIRTFDSCMFDYQAIGSHTLFEHSLLSVSGTFESCSNGKQTCLRSVLVETSLGDSHSIEYGVGIQSIGPVSKQSLPDSLIIDGVVRPYSTISSAGLNVGSSSDSSDSSSSSSSGSIVCHREGTDELHISVEIGSGKNDHVHIRIGRRFAVIWAPEAMPNESLTGGLCGSPNGRPQDDLKIGELELGCERFERLDSSLQTSAALAFKHEIGVNDTVDALEERYQNTFAFEDKQTLLTALEICEESLPTTTFANDHDHDNDDNDNDHSDNNALSEAIADEERSAAIENCLFDWDEDDLSTALSNAKALVIVANARLPPSDDEADEADEEDEDAKWRILAIMSLVAAVASVLGMVVLRKRMNRLNNDNMAEIALLRQEIQRAEVHL